MMTTLCDCWKIEAKSSGQVVRATNHDRALIWQGETYEPTLAVKMSGLVQTLRFAPEPADLEGALDSEGFTSEDFRAGVWDGAKVTIYRVNWATPEYGYWLWTGYLTEIEDNGGRFSVRLASIKSDMERTIGRAFGRRCDARLGDARCGVVLASAPQITCNKQFATCRDIFGNAANFRGFPHMPGNDAIISGPGDRRDGSSRGIET